MKSKLEELQKYFYNIQRANTELAKKELLKNLLVRLFDADKKASKIIDQMSLGSEKTIFKIPLKDRLKTGAADTQYGNIIIEFEKSIQSSGKLGHAVEQLREYLAGNWKSNQVYNFTLVATDCISWKIYTVDSEKWIYDTNSIFTASDIILKQKDSFILTDKNLEEFPFFLDRYLFKFTKFPATLENIKNEFGESSETFLTALNLMTKHYSNIQNELEIQTAYNQWERFLSIAYGRFVGNTKVFLVHTYLSVFSKILAFSILSKDKEFIEDNELREILSGKIFDNFHIENFVVNDFYYWIANEKNYKILRPVFQKILQTLENFDFSKIQEDILKGVYQELIDIETRHKLGEYYTPDWLCNEIIDTFEIQRGSTFFDPACGSGSFIRSFIGKIKKLIPKITAEEILSQVSGIDIHPLSLQIAKTNILLEISDLIKTVKKPMEMKLYLANSLLVPEGVELFQNQLSVKMADKEYILDKSILEKPDVFDEAIKFCDRIADSYLHRKEVMDEKEFTKQLTITIKNIKKEILIHNLEKYPFYKIFKDLKEKKEKYQDGIWKFILINLYKPFFITNSFDFIAGNPPWLTYAMFSNKEYQTILNKLANEYELVPSIANMPHLEIASIFLSHASEKFLKPGGKLAFVLPRSFLSADQHKNFRSGTSIGFRLTSIWDLGDVKPLFNVPAMVAFTEKENKKEKRMIPKSGIPGHILSGKMKQDDTQIGLWGDMSGKINKSKVTWYYTTLGDRTAFSDKKNETMEGANYYAPYFKQGATIVPRNFYFVDVLEEIPKKKADREDRIVVVKTAEHILKDAKPPWNEFILKDQVNTNFLFTTAISKSILPFALINPVFVALPITIERIGKQKEIQLLDADKILGIGDYYSSKYFREAEKLWNKHRTERSESMSTGQRLNYQKGLAGQDMNSKYLVLYNASAKDANAVVIERRKFIFPFIVESTTYWYATNDIEEAVYICSFLNSNFANKQIKSFQAKGLFGERHVHKTILQVPLLQYKSSKKDHKKLANIGELCIQKTKDFITKRDTSEVSGLKLGNLRLKIREHLYKELNEIDKVLESLNI
ncbi:MAG: SAM-dependent DNA methyltransferase [Leptospiraceae bacterium]|nr:SAM-dependent DNA methyltransferase [Leptospiraceae bacterium]